MRGNPKGIGLAVLALAAGVGAWSQVPSASPSVTVPVAPRKSEVTGALPAVLALQERSRGATDARLPNAGPRLPQRVAPSAARWGHMTYSWVPPDLQFYAGLGERPESTRESYCFLVEATLGGRKSVKLALETDAANLLLSARALRKLGLKPPAAGGDASSPAATIELEHLQIGPLSFQGVTAWVVDEKGVLPEPADGVLPLWYLSSLGLQWGGGGRELTLHPEETTAERVLGSGYSTADLEWHGGRPFVEAILGDRARGRVLLSPLTQRTVFDSEVLDKAGVKYWPVMQPDPGYQWVRGISENLRVLLGRTEVTIRRGCIADLGLHEESMGVLGRDVLGLFDLFVDGRRGTVAFRRVPSSSGEPTKP